MTSTMPLDDSQRAHVKRVRALGDVTRQRDERVRHRLRIIIGCAGKQNMRKYRINN